MIDYKNVAAGDILLWHPKGDEPEYHLMLEIIFSKREEAEWLALCLNSGQTEEVSVNTTNNINWTRVA